MKKLFLDANILIDIADDARPTSHDSAKLFSYLMQNSKHFELYTSCDLITTVYYLLKKPLGKKKSLEQLKIMIGVIRVIEFNNKEIDEAIYLMEKDSNFGDLEDTIQYVMARKELCDYIITNDQEFYSYEIPLLSSAKALGIIF